MREIPVIQKKLMYSHHIFWKPTLGASFFALTKQVIQMVVCISSFAVTCDFDDVSRPQVEVALPTRTVGHDCTGQLISTLPLLADCTAAVCTGGGGGGGDATEGAGPGGGGGGGWSSSQVRGTDESMHRCGGSSGPPYKHPLPKS